MSLPPDYPRSSEELRDWLASGRLVRFPKDPPADMTPAAWDALRTVSGAVLKSLFDTATRICAIPVRLRNVIVDGNLDLSYGTCALEFSITDGSRFTQIVNLSYVKFLGVADFSGSLFDDEVKFDFVRCSYDLRIARARFGKRATFQGAVIAGRLAGDAAVFDVCNFSRATIANGATFRAVYENNAWLPTRFTNDVQFLATRFERGVEFDGAEFSGRLDLSQSTIEGDALFRAAQDRTSRAEKAAEFAGEVLFRDAYVAGNADFNGAHFSKEVNFARLRVGGSVFCRSISAVCQARFDARSSFEALQVGGRVAFQGSHFLGPCSFEAAQIKGTASFRAAPELQVSTVFGAGLNFRDVQIGANVDFSGSVFRADTSQGSSLAADFMRCRIGGSALFQGVAGQQGKLLPQFDGETRFDDMSVQGTCAFTGAQFNDAASFRRVLFASSVFFGFMEIEGEPISAAFQEQVNFREARFGGSADFTGVRFGAESTWDRAAIEGATFFRPLPGEDGQAVRFEGPAWFRDTQIAGTADFLGAEFCDRVDFRGMRVGGSGVFAGARVRGQCWWDHVVIEGEAIFRALSHGVGQIAPVTFDRDCSFRGMHVGRGADYRNATFNARADFVEVRIQGSADFSGATFGGIAAWDRAVIGGDASFRRAAPDRESKAVTFADRALFRDMQITGIADFSGAEFKSDANFTRAKFGAAAIFSTATFRTSARFERTVVNGSADFGRSTFEAEGNFEGFEVDGDAYFDQGAEFQGVTLVGARFGKQALFSAARFNSDVRIARTQVSGLLAFRHATFLGALSLEDTQVNAIAFDDSVGRADSLPKWIDLRGFTYSRIIGPWRRILSRIQKDASGSHLQPFSQLERYLRSSGYDRDADEVYLERRKEEARMLTRRVFGNVKDREQAWPAAAWKLLEDCWLRLIFNYGVPSYRFLVVAGIFFAAGMLLLSMPGALRLNSDAAQTQAAYPAGERAIAALGALVAGVVPGEGSKKVTQWQPSRLCPCVNCGTFEQWASALTIAIYACITIAVASLAGLIKRKPS